MADGMADDTTGHGAEPGPGAAAAPATEDDLVTCQWCGKRRPADGCACNADGKGPGVLEGWDPALTRTDRPRLKLTGRQE
jgi:hypothetical protein